MTTLEKIRAEIEQIIPIELPYNKRTPEHIRDMALEIIDRYAEQETDIEYIGKFCHTHGLVLMSKEMADKYAEPCGMTTLEKKHIQRLQERKAELIDEFIGRCEEINYQIKAIKSGKWKFVEADDGKEQNDNT